MLVHHAEALRDKIHNLDLTISSNQQTYNDILKYILMLNELYWIHNHNNTAQPIINCKKYLDNNHSPNVTVGIGFNMDRKFAREEWNDAFNNSVSFDEVYSGEKKLTELQAVHLLNYSISIRGKEIVKFYKDFWDKLKANEKLAIQEVHYNCPSVVTEYTDKISGRRHKTQFFINIKRYAETFDYQYLKRAVCELKMRSNPSKNKGIQNRRNAEAAMLESYKC
jgi:hypothetical protein